MNIKQLTDKTVCDIVANEDGTSFEVVRFDERIDEFVQKRPLREVLIDLVMESDFVRLAIEVRKLQKKYFETRASADLVAARAAEAAFDKAIEAMQKARQTKQPPIVPVQQTIK